MSAWDDVSDHIDIDDLDINYSPPLPSYNNNDDVYVPNEDDNNYHNNNSDHLHHWQRYSSYNNNKNNNNGIPQHHLNLIKAPPLISAAQNSPQINALKSQIATLEEREKKHNHEIEKLKKDRVELKKQKRENERVQKKNAALSQQFEREKMVSNNTTKELSQLTAKTNKEKKALKLQLSQSQIEIGKLNKEKTASQREANRYKQEIGKLKKEKTAFQIEVNRYKQEIGKIKKEKTASQREINQYKQEIVSLKAVKSYTINAIIEKNEIELKHDINYINKGIGFDDYDNVLNIHNKIINEWNENTKKLQNIESEIVTSGKITMKKYFVNDDEKKADNDAMNGKQNNIESCNQLFSSYIACNQLIDEQAKRLDQITSNSHIVRLFKNKDTLQVQLNTNKSKSTAKSQENEDMKRNYVETKDKRISLIKTIDAAVIECNQTIKRENDLLDKIQQATNLLNLLDKQKKQLSSLSDKCESLILAYNLFEKTNNECKDHIYDHFNKKWKEFESEWYKWKVIDIVCWFKYKTFTINASSVDWENVQNQMIKRNIKGESLINFENATLDLIGIVDFNIAVFLMKKITTLINTYPIAMKYTRDNQNNCKIPKKFICPLTNDIMSDPVMAFDRNIYEREAIEKYLKENGKSPITGKQASSLHVFAKKQLQSEIQIYRSLTNMDKEGITTKTILI